MTDEQWSTVLDVTLTGTFRCTRAALRHMLGRGGGGVIVNNASVLGWRAQAGQAHYAAAKAGVMALTRCAAVEARRTRRPGQRRLPEPGRAPVPQRVMSDEDLEELRPTRGLRPGGRDVGGGQRDRLPGQRLRHLHDRRGRLRLRPSTRDRPEPPPARRCTTLTACQM